MKTFSKKDLKYLIKATAKILDAEKRMDEIAARMKAYGIEAIDVEGEYVSQYWQNIVALYVNVGEAYDLTVVYDTRYDQFEIIAWADFAERLDRQRQPSPSFLIT